MDDQNKNIKKLKRSKTDRIVAGVFGGMGEYFQMDPIIFRLAGVLLFFLSGLIPFIVAYIIAIVIIPEEEIESGIKDDSPVHKKWWFWLIIIIALFLFLAPILAFLGLKSYADKFQELFYLPETEIAERYRYTERQVDEEQLPAPEESAVNDYLEGAIVTANFGGEIFAEYHEFGRATDELFIWAYVVELYETDGELQTGTATSLPLIIEFTEDEVTGHRAPRDGPYYEEDVRAMFPDVLYDNIINFQSIHRETINGLKNKAEQRAQENI